MKLAAEADQGTGRKRLQIELGVIELPLGFRVGGRQDLKPAVDPKAVDKVGPYTPANVTRRLDHDDLDSRLMQRLGTGQSGDTGTNHDDSLGWHSQPLSTQGEHMPSNLQWQTGAGKLLLATALTSPGLAG